MAPPGEFGYATAVPPGKFARWLSLILLPWGPGLLRLLYGAVVRGRGRHGLVRDKPLAVMIPSWMAPGSSAKQRSPRICAASPFNLRFEHRRILDWIAYHHFVGIECFFLMHADPEEDSYSPAARHVHQMLLSASPMVEIKLINITFREKLEMWNLDQLASFVQEQGATYIATFDVDEFLVFDKKLAARPLRSRPCAPDLGRYLDDLIGRRGLAGMYIYRWDYGPGQWYHPPPLRGRPEFTFFRYRIGDRDRARPYKQTGKIIWNTAAFGNATLTVKMICSEHGWNSTIDPAAMPLAVAFADGSDVNATGDHVGCVVPQNYSWHRQPWSINHYVTGSRSECKLKKVLGKHWRDRRESCRVKYPVGDPIMLPCESWAVERRRVLFPGYKPLQV